MLGLMINGHMLDGNKYSGAESKGGPEGRGYWFPVIVT